MKVLVTGVSGFVAQALALELHNQGYEVTGTSRSPVILPFPVIQIDLSKNDLNLDGFEAVFHVASKVAMWGNFDEFYHANVVATEKLIAACKTVKYFIYTSSPSVIAGGTNLCNVNESILYPKKYLANYPKTKAIAEKYVLESNNEKLYTVSLRPHLIFGKGDRNFVPTILSRARSNRLVQVGDGNNKVDVCYIKDCVTAHILALKALIANPDSRGKAYFISQGEPVKLFSWINQVLKLNNIAPIKKKISFKFAFCLASVLEFFAKFTSKEPLLTKFLVEEMATDHYFDISAAKRDLGYSPRYTVEQAMAETFLER